MSDDHYSAADFAGELTRYDLRVVASSHLGERRYKLTLGPGEFSEWVRTLTRLREPADDFDWTVDAIETEGEFLAVVITLPGEVPR